MGKKISHETPSNIFKNTVYNTGNKYKQGKIFIIERPWLGHTYDLYLDELYCRRGWEEEQIELFKNGYYAYINELTVKRGWNNYVTLLTVYKLSSNTKIDPYIINNVHKSKNSWILINYDANDHARLKQILYELYDLNLVEIRDADISNSLYWIKVQQK